MKTIPKNRTAKVFDAITAAKSYRLENCFSGAPLTDLDHLRTYLDKFGADAKTVFDKETGKGKVRFHSNHWIEFEARV